MKLSAVIFLLFPILGTYAQEKLPGRLGKFVNSLPSAISADEGSIILKDGTQLEGMVSYQAGVLKYMSPGKSRVFDCSEVVGFEVYDQSFDGMRLFYSLQKVDAVMRQPSMHFYELVEDFGSFSVLIGNDNPEIENVQKYRTTWDNPKPGSGKAPTPYTVNGEEYVSIKLVETIYLLKPTGNPEPFFSTILETSSKEKLVGDGQSTKTKFLNKELLQEYMGKHYESVKAYARTNGYSFKDKSDFLKTLAYYQTLID